MKILNFSTTNIAYFSNVPLLCTRMTTTKGWFSRATQAQAQESYFTVKTGSTQAQARTQAQAQG